MRLSSGYRSYLLDVVEQGDLGAGRLAYFRGSLQQLLRQPGKCAEANHLHAIVMGVARCPYRSAETSDDADGNAIGAQYRCCDSRRSQTIAPQPTTAIFAILLSVQAAR